MTQAIIVAVITGAFSLLGVILTVKSTTDKSTQEIKTEQVILQTKLEELTREVREHNNFAKRMPVVEEQIKVINHRLSDVENKGA